MSAASLMDPTTHTIRVSLLPNLLGHVFRYTTLAKHLPKEELDTIPTYNDLVNEVRMLKDRLDAYESNNAASTPSRRTFETARSRRTRKNRK